MTCRQALECARCRWVEKSSLTIKTHVTRYVPMLKKYITSRRRSVTGLSASGTWKISKLTGVAILLGNAELLLAVFLTELAKAWQPCFVPYLVLRSLASTFHAVRHPMTRVIGLSHNLRRWLSTRFSISPRRWIIITKRRLSERCEIQNLVEAHRRISLRRFGFHQKRFEFNEVAKGGE